MIADNKELNSFNRLENLINIVIRDLKKYESWNKISFRPDLLSKIRNICKMAIKCLPDYEELFNHFYIVCSHATVEDTLNFLSHTLELIGFEKETASKINDLKIFEGAEDKLKQSNSCFRNNDYPSTMNNLNTSIELALKNKLDIPLTITGINLTNIIEILVKYKIGPYTYLKEAQKHVTMIDNKIKHQGYSPSKFDCINAIKATEDLISKLRTQNIELTDEIKKKIYEEL